MEDLIKRDDAISKTFCASIDGVPRMVVLLDDIKAIPSVDLNEVFDEWASHWFKDFEALKHRLEMHEEAMLKTMNGDAHKATYINALENRIKELEADRPSGEWIFKTVFPNDKSEFPMGYLVCSVCGSHHSNSTPCNYCDNCGARMKGADDE